MAIVEKIKTAPIQENRFTKRVQIEPNFSHSNQVNFDEFLIHKNGMSCVRRESTHYNSKQFFLMHFSCIVLTELHSFCCVYPYILVLAIGNHIRIIEYVNYLLYSLSYNKLSFFLCSNVNGIRIIHSIVHYVAETNDFSTMFPKSRTYIFIVSNNF